MEALDINLLQKTIVSTDNRRTDKRTDMYDNNR